jgi:hypothetical protein
MSAVPNSSRWNTAQEGTAAVRRRSPGSAGRITTAAAVAAFFVAGQAAFRHWEALAVAGGVRSLGFHGVLGVQGSHILLRSGSGSRFWIDITPSSLCLVSALAIALIATVISVTNPLSDRLLAAAAGVAVTIAGNLIWIGSSVATGVQAGRGSLILFYSRAGSIFVFAITVGGFLLTLFVLLRRKHLREGM